MVVEVFLQLVGKTSGIEQIIDAQRPPRHLVFIGWADALAGGADAQIRALRCLAGVIEGGVVGQYDRTTRTDPETRADIDATRLEDPDLADQMMNIQHDPVADETGNSLTNDPGGNQIEFVHLVADHQRVTGVVTALKTNDTLGMISQPVYDLALTLIAPLGAHHHDVPSHSCDPFL